MILMAAFLFVGFAACGGTTTQAPTTQAPTTQAPTTQAPTTQAPTTQAPTTQPPTTQPPTTEVPNADPIISGTADIEVFVGEAFDPLAGVTAFDNEDGNLTSAVTFTGTVDLSTAGPYTLVYSVTDSQGGVAEATRVVTVVALPEASLPTGFYNFKFATTDLRHTFMAAAEKYLMNTMAGGVPLFANGSFALYSSRLQFPVDDYMPVMGFGLSFGTFSADDSTVLMDDGNPGNAGEYTYRTASTTNPVTWNHWLYDTSTDSDYMGFYMDALYVYEFNEDKTGYAVNPSMAANFPIPVNSTITDTGKEVSKTWRIPLKTDLTWYYHPSTNISGLPAGHEHINAHDFIDTYKLALDKGWFRAISGGGDFITSSNAIANAKEYRDGEVNWDAVGLKVYDDYTLEFTFVNDQSEWNVRYFLSSFVMTPINIDLYNALQVGENNSYGTSNTTIAYHGPYYVDYFEADKVLRYKENPNYHSPDKYFYTGYSFVIIEEAEVRFQEFIAGKLEGVGLPVGDYDEYKDHPGIKRIPGPTTFRMMINGLETVDKQRDQFPSGSWIPEPILANHDFKMAMFFAIDRQTLAEEVLKTSTTQMYLFTDAYMVDPEGGIPYRQTAQGLTVGQGLSPSTFGFNPDAAQAYWELAIDALVADGVYTPGTAGNYTIIDLDFYIFSGSEAQILLGEYVKSQFESIFTSPEHYIRVRINVDPKDFPGIYHDYMMVGEFDLAIGGISGSTLDAASFLDVFADDNRGGFTLNWGIDTSSANIEVRYNTFDGARHREIWSFNAITAVLNGLAYIQDGQEAKVPAPVILEITPTTFRFRINEFNNPAYQNITYTIQEWDLDAETYVNVEGMVDVLALTQEILVTGLKPYPYDYQIVINFEYVEDPDLEATPTSTWDYSARLVLSAVTTEDTAVITLNTADLPREFVEESIQVFLSADDTEVTDDVTIVVDGAVVTISGLDAETGYYITFLTDDTHLDFEDEWLINYAFYRSFTTKAEVVE